MDEPHKRSLLKGEAWIAALLAVLGLAVIYIAVELKIGTMFEPGPGLFPAIGGTAVAVLCLARLAQRATTAACPGAASDMEPVAEGGRSGRPLILVATLLAYGLLLDSVGYLLATTALAAIVMLLTHKPSWTTVICGSPAVAVGSFVIFGKLLGINLPKGPVFF